MDYRSSGNIRKTFDVSASTLRRWCTQGPLPLYRACTSVNCRVSTYVNMYVRGYVCTYRCVCIL